VRVRASVAALANRARRAQAETPSKSLTREAARSSAWPRIRGPFLALYHGMATAPSRATQAAPARRAVSTRLPTPPGDFQAYGCERDVVEGAGPRVEAAPVLVLRVPRAGAPLVALAS